jgi:group II intron reverse transcriptase/maturase
MSKSLLEQALSPEVLDSSWRRLRNEHTPWSIDINREQLQQHLLLHILETRNAVLENRYRPQPLRQFPMSKANGKTRIISAQFLQDKLIQRALLTVLEPRAEALFHNDSYAYRPGRSVQMALGKTTERVRVGLTWLADADIKSFFDSIPHRSLLKLLKPFINDPKAFQLIEKWIKLGAHQSSLLTTRRGISQGAILSPLLCNLYLHQFDTAMSKANIPFVRFADDFLLFANTQTQAQKALDYATSILKKLGLHTHPQKTQVIRSSRKIQFLGEPLPQPAQ